MDNVPEPDSVNDNCDGKSEQLDEQLSAEEIEGRRAECESLKREGNAKFKDKQLDEAIALYSQAIRLCPLINVQERSILFNNRAAAYYHKHGESIELGTKKEGDDDDDDDDDYTDQERRKKLTEVEEEEEVHEGTSKTESWLDKCVADCTSSIDLNGNYVKPYLKRAQAYRKMGKEKLDLSLEDYEMVIKIDPSMKECYQAINELKEEIDKRNEEMKNEMIGKLKDIGNVVLNKFGLSTDNFQMVKNPDTGSYSINFKS